MSFPFFYQQRGLKYKFLTKNKKINAFKFNKEWDLFLKKINKKAFCSKNLRNLFCVGLWGYFHRAGNDLQFYYFFFCKKII